MMFLFNMVDIENKITTHLQFDVVFSYALNIF